MLLRLIIDERIKTVPAIEIVLWRMEHVLWTTEFVLWLM